MTTAKVFTSGGSQAVRLPKALRFETDEVLISKIGNTVILMPKDDPWASMMSALDMFTDDFLSEGTTDLPLQERAPL